MTSANAVPKRSGQACTRCRQQKMKCSGDPGPCDRCAKFRRECIFEPANTNTNNTSNNAINGNNGSNGSNETSATAVTRFQQNQPSTQSHLRQLHSPHTPSDGSQSLHPLDQQSHSRTHATRKRSLEAASAGDWWKAGRAHRPTMRSDCLMPTITTPYSSVQELEISQESWHAGYRTPSDHRAGDVRDTSNPSALSPRGVEDGLNGLNANGTRDRLLECLTEAEIAVVDAQELFLLFGERLSPFIPSFYATDFSTLPTEPLYVLAAIYAVARYLPDSTALRDRIFRILRRLLSDLMLRPAVGQSRSLAENMQGLVILYGTCEATGPGPDDQCARQYLDMLTLKGIAESYAVKVKLGVDNPINRDFPGKLPLVWTVWLYTMSHHCAVIHGCPRTLSGSADLLGAKVALEQAVDHPRIRLLIGECELCLLWERAMSIHGSSPETVYNALDQWRTEWQGFLTGTAAAGRQLYFHFFFTRFHLFTHLIDETGGLYVAGSESLDSAYDFLQSIGSLSPLSKDRMRYLCDFAFVLMAYVCLYVLRALTSGIVLPGNRTEVLRLVREVAALMQSFGARADTRPIVYGCALEAMCQQVQTLLDGIITGTGLHSQGASEGLNQSRPSHVNIDLTMEADALMETNIFQQSRISTDFWTLDPDLSVFDGIMEGIPVPEKT